MKIFILCIYTILCYVIYYVKNKAKNSVSTFSDCYFCVVISRVVGAGALETALPSEQQMGSSCSRPVAQHQLQDHHNTRLLTVTISCRTTTTHGYLRLPSAAGPPQHTVPYGYHQLQDHHNTRLLTVTISSRTNTTHGYLRLP